MTETRVQQRQQERVEAPVQQALPENLARRLKANLSNEGFEAIAALMGQAKASEPARFGLFSSAARYLGTPYRLPSQTKGLDCSAFITVALRSEFRTQAWFTSDSLFSAAVASGARTYSKSDFPALVKTLKPMDILVTPGYYLKDGGRVNGHALFFLADAGGEHAWIMDSSLVKGVAIRKVSYRELAAMMTRRGSRNTECAVVAGSEIQAILPSAGSVRVELADITPAKTGRQNAGP